jgi:predicted regulator of Ras-like GTPase activity (Roadblock/LC7/MglB family)
MFKQVLQEIVESTPGAQAAVLMGGDGITVEHFNQSDMSADGGQSLAVEFATVVKEAAHTVSLLNVGRLDEIAVKCEQMTVIISILTPEYFVALLMEPDGNAGKGRYLLKRDAHKLRTALES